MQKDKNEIKCIVTFQGNGYFRRLPMTFEAYQYAQKYGLNKFFNELMADLGGNSYSYEVIK